MSDTRADTTSMGLLGISFIMLVFGLIGILGYGDNPGGEFTGLMQMSIPMMVGAGLLFLFIAYTNWKSGNKFLMYLFAFLGLVSFAYAAPGFGTWVVNENAYLFFIVVTIFFMIFALVTFLSKGGLMLTLLLVAAGLVFLFFALATNAGSNGDDMNTFMLMLGVFAILAFLISLYMALADITDLNLPVV